MHISVPSFAILSLFAATGHAFAPPTSSASTRSSQLYAKNELSGLLSEYSDSSVSTAASKAVEKVADAVVSSPVVVAPPSEISESAVDSVMKAASVAQDAADQATAAAAAFTSAASKITVTKAATVGAGVAAGGTAVKPLVLKPLIGGVIIPTDRALYQVDPSKVTTTADNAAAAARAKENLAILKANFLNGIGAVKEGADGASTKASSVDFDLPNLGSVSVPAMADIIASLHLKEYGGWYATAAMAIYASQQRTAGAESANAKYEAEMASARGKASEAASAAGLAAEGAKTAKKLAMKMEKDLKKDGGNALLESSRAKMAEMEMSIMENEMRALQAEVASLRSQLEKATEGKKKKSTKKKPVKTEIEAEYPSIVVMESDPEEEGRIIEILKAMDEENATRKKKAAEEAEKLREAEAKFVAAEKIKAESKKMTKGVEAAQKKAEAAIKKKSSTKKAAKKKSATKKAITKKAATKAAVKKVVVKNVEKVVVKNVQKVVVKNVPKKAVAANADDWASLADSTLKRKTVVQLSEYLTGKGVTVTDGSGKSLKKAELLAAVKGL